MGLKVVSFEKKVQGDFLLLEVVNELYTMKMPKLLFKLIHPDKNGDKDYIPEKAYLDVKETCALIRAIKFRQEPEIFKSFKGSLDKTLGKVVARVFSLKRKGNIFVLALELAEGQQSFVLNKAGQKVPGVVKPLGGHTIRQASIALSREEVLCLADLLDKELNAWRTALNLDCFYHPEKYAGKSKS